jgi:hypothetical protein
MKFEIFTVIAVVVGAIVIRHMVRVPKSCVDVVCRRGLFGDS